MATRITRRSPNDGYPTVTSEIQATTEDTLLKYIPDGSQSLQKNAHIQFLARNMIQGLPARYTGQDASQPWILFWTLQSFSTLQVGLDPGNRQRAIDTIMTWQHPDGGFGGGPGQSAHLLPTYAAVCALANVGRPGLGGGWDQIDRDKMYKFFMSLKQPDGSFLVAHHAEVDVRGIYCLLVVAHLLNLLTPELVEGTAAFVASCQTYEGGFSSASQPYFTGSDSDGGPPTLMSSPRPPLGEAHGGYTFCALATWVMLQPFVSEIPEPHRPSIDMHTLLRWLSHMQGSEIDLGGFKGRTNKLVDACYSWWVGASFALLEALGVGGFKESEPTPPEQPVTEKDEAVWGDVDDTLLNRKALQEFILYAGQHPAGGLRDKPPKGPDAYHTLYSLSGLSVAQHRVYCSPLRRHVLNKNWKSSDDPKLDPIRKEAFVASLCWTEEEGASKYVGGTANRVNATHPIFNLTISHTEALMAHFYEQILQKRPIPAKAP